VGGGVAGGEGGATFAGEGGDGDDGVTALAIGVVGDGVVGDGPGEAGAPFLHAARPAAATSTTMNDDLRIDWVAGSGRDEDTAVPRCP